MMYRFIQIFLVSFLLTACGGGGGGDSSSNDSSSGDTRQTPQPTDLVSYFPPNGSDVWETGSVESLGWNAAAVDDLTNFLEQRGTRAFIVLKDGKIVIEEYFDNSLFAQPFDQNSVWYWASAGKTLTAFLIGKAQEEGYLNINDSSASYLGAGWTNTDSLQEQQITILHQLTMTSGLDDEVADNHCTDPSCLIYKADPDTRWAYHNGAYTLLDRVIENATEQTFDDYFDSRLQDKIGMDGYWLYVDYNHLYHSTARSMARFGLLILNQGTWGDEQIINDEAFFTAMTSPSQNINQSYGYLWWLNGQASYMLPSVQLVFPSQLAPSAPADMIAAIGKNSQLINIVPSENLVVIRMGEDPDLSPVPTTFQEQLWQYINPVINRQ